MIDNNSTNIINYDVPYFHEIKKSIFFHAYLVSLNSVSIAYEKNDLLYELVNFSDTFYGLTVVPTYDYRNSKPCDRFIKISILLGAYVGRNNLVKQWYFSRLYSL